jgi:D-alanine-D-alanine ligase-like ATP-grasp enzyme
MPKCVYCGANPIPHFSTRVNEGLNLALMPFNRLVFGGWFGQLLDIMGEKISDALIELFHLAGLATYNDDITTAKTLRGKVLWEEAQSRGIPMQSIRMLGKEVDMYRAKIGRKWIAFRSLPRPASLTNASQWWLDDKWILKQKLLEAGVPVAPGGSYSRYTPLLQRFRTLQKPVIIKPRLGSRGRHTTTFIYTEEQLHKAFLVAKEICPAVILEEHLEGSVYRGTMIKGKLAGVLGGDPPRITGDGTHTIAELIVLKNATKPDKIKDVVVTPIMEEFLARGGRTLTTVLKTGEIIDLSEKIGISYGGSSAEVTDITHPETKRILEAAAAVVDDPIIGFDFIIKDISRSPHEQKWGIIECNGVPFINLHHFPITGKPVNVAEKVWDMIEEELRQ